MKLYLVRHGEADSKIDETPLTEKGFSQAKVVSKELSKFSFDKIYSSSLLRAKQTCEEFSSDYIEDNRLKEVYRVLIGGPVKENVRENREEEDRKNADAAFDELLNLDCDNVLVFCHANIIRYFISKVQGLNGRNLWADMKIDNCSMTIFTNINAIINIEEINRNGYLIKDSEVRYIEE